MPRIADAMESDTRAEYEVVVVGAGPVGLATGLALGRDGVRVLVVDRERELNVHPRAVHFDGESMRFFQTLGIAEAMRGLSVPVHRMDFVDEHGDLLFDVAFGEGEGPQGWPSAQLFHQPDLERLLAAAVDACQTVTLRLGQEVVDVGQHDGPVDVHLVATDGSAAATQVSARYVVGCDGAGSTVRKRIGSTWESLGPAQPWLVVDGRLLHDEGSLPTVPQQRPWPRRPQFFMRNVGDRVRWEFRIMPADDPGSIADEPNVNKLIRESVDPTYVRIERATVYTFRSLLADRWRSGSVFLAGDAAHLQPPFMAQGLCSGLRDVANLTWKLTHAVRTGYEAVLDSYESERRPHAAAWVTEATRVAELCQEIDAQQAETRNTYLRERAGSLTPLIPGLGAGLHGENVAPAGVLTPQPRLSDGRRLDDDTGRRFVLLHTAASPFPSTDLLRGVVPFSGADHPGVETTLQDLGHPYAVIRPDRYLLGVASDRHELLDVLKQIP